MHCSPIITREFIIVTQILLILPFPSLPFVHSSLPREEHLFFHDVLPLDPRARYILSNYDVYICALTWLSLSALAQGRGEETRSRDEEGFRFAPAGRGGVERSRNVKEAEEEEEEGRNPGMDLRSERSEREAIRECLMPRTKLCNYLYVRLRPS